MRNLHTVPRVAPAERQQLSARQLNKLYNALYDVVCIFDAAGKFLFVNNVVTSVLGYTEEELIGTSCFDYMHPDDRALSRQETEDFVEGAPARTFENRYLHKNGALVVMRWIGRWCNQDQVMYCTGRDVTKLIQSEQELELLSLIAKETVNVIIVTDLDGKISWVNEAFTQNTGYRFDEVVGQYPGPILACKRKDHATKKFLDEKVARRESFRLEIENGKKDGSTCWWEVYYQPLYDKQGNIQKFFSLNTDITERKRLEQHLAKEQAQFRKKITTAVVKASEAERASVSQELHDNVNQMLTTVKLYQELIASGNDTKGDLVQRSIQLLTTSINEIRGLSKRLSAPSLGDIGINDSLAELVDSMSAASDACIELSISDVFLPLSMCKELHLSLYRITQEQLTNVFKHARASHVFILLGLKNRRVTLSIQDNGKGFNTRLKGKGIGLTNIVSRAEIFNGTAKLKSAPGKGCSLIVTIPVKVNKKNIMCCTPKGGHSN